jgi:hypothetical protein
MAVLSTYRIVRIWNTAYYAGSYDYNDQLENKMNKMKQAKIILFMLVLLACLGISASAQQILFDKGIRAGALTVFPELSNPDNYYYLSDKIQVSKHPDGSPEFSFMRYVRNTAPGNTTNAITETNQAGGVLHVLVNLAVPEEMIREARQELLRINGSAKLMGPIIFKSGKVAVISSVIGDNGELTRKVVGLGSAPILEGEKAAVSVLLTKEGADILWATFQTATPDLSFQFEMDVRGYLSPKNIKIEANFDQIYKHRTIEAAAVSPVFALEIKDAFDDLSNSGAIKVTQVGEDEGLNKLKERLIINWSILFLTKSEARVCRISAVCCHRTVKACSTGLQKCLIKPGPMQWLKIRDWIGWNQNAGKGKRFPETGHEGRWILFTVPEISFIRNFQLHPHLKMKRKSKGFLFRSLPSLPLLS